MASVVPKEAADLFASRRLKVSLKNGDWELLEFAAMDDGRSLNGEVAFLLRELLRAARRGTEDHPGLLGVWFYQGGIAVEHR